MQHPQNRMAMADDSEEIWKPIPGYEGFYEVSDLGNVRSLNYRRTGKPHLLKGRLKKDGTVLYLFHTNGQTQTFFAERLVWEAFHGPIPVRYTVSHIDKDRQNNRLINLMLLSFEFIIQHTRLKRYLWEHPKPVLQCDWNGKVIQEWLSIKMAADANGYASSRPIHRSLKSGFSTANGFVWKYKQPDDAAGRLVLRIREIAALKKFESLFFNKKYGASIRKRNWEQFDPNTIPKRMSEVVEIGRGKYKRTRAIDIDISRPKLDQLFLCYIVYFVKGRTSASYKRNPLGFIVQSPEFRDRVLDTRLHIKTPEVFPVSGSINLLEQVNADIEHHDKP